MNNYMRRLMKKIQMLNNQRKLKFEFIIKNSFPRIKVQEKHEKIVKWAIRVLTIIGIGLSVVTFTKWYYGLGISIVLFFINQVFEKMIFTYTIMIVQAMPNKWNGTAWTMMVVGMFKDRYVLAFGFKEKDVAMDFFDTILHWNNNMLINDNQINISLVLEDQYNYSVHVYPNIENEFVLKAINEAEEKYKYDKYGKDQTNLAMQIDICKVFPNSRNSAYNILKDFHDDVYISVYDTSNFSEDDPNTIKNIRPFDDRKILNKNIKVIKRNDLDKQNDTIEYFHIPKY